MLRRTKKEVLVATKINLELHRRLTQKAKEEDRSVAAVVRRCIEHYLNGETDGHAKPSS
jgi:predicted DNA-binding protein